MTSRHAIVLGALLAATGVALGAFGAHGLEDLLVARGYEAELPNRLAWFDTAVRYQLYHALGIIVVAHVAQRRATPLAFLLGIVLFCGSLFAMTFLPPEWKKLGAITPLGGLAFIVGWVMFATQTWRQR